VLLYGALASQEANHDSIDMAFISAAKEKDILNNSFVKKTFIPFDPDTRKTEATIVNADGDFKVMKGAFEVIAKICALNEKDLAPMQNQVNKFAISGYRTIAVAQVKDTGVPNFVGIVALHDPPRPDSLKIINELKDLGLTIKMLTGDAVPIAKEISKTLNIGDKILNASVFTNSLKSGPAAAVELLEQNNGFAGVYPEDKYNIVKALQTKGHIVGMTGDGVNDAPALKQAEVGIAVSNASDVAKGAASLVLIKEGLSNIPAPIKVGRMMFERINIWILNKIARTISKTCFIVFAFLVLGKFIISATAMLVMIFMTDFVKISLSTDNVDWSKKPAVWNINALVKIGTVIGAIMTMEAFVLLYIGLHYFKLNTDNNALNTFSFEILLFLALFSIVVVRGKKHF
jgi:H+-transporting ATPase